MRTSDLEATVRAANPVPTREPSTLSREDERLLASILATPRRRRFSVGRVIMPLAAAAAVAAVVVIVVTNRPTEVVPGKSGANTIPAGNIVHVVVQQYSMLTSGHVVADGRIEGWAQRSTGRARIVDRAQNGGLREEIYVDGTNRVVRWLGVGSPQITSRISPSLARTDRRLVTDRIDARAQEDELSAMAGAAGRIIRTLHVRYAGHAAIQRETVVVGKFLTPSGLKPHGTCISTFRDAATGAPLGYERGDCDPRGGHYQVIGGERVLVNEVLSAKSAAGQLDWRPTPGPASTPTPVSTP